MTSICDACDSDPCLCDTAVLCAICGDDIEECTGECGEDLELPVHGSGWTDADDEGVHCRRWPGCGCFVGCHIRSARERLQ